MSVCTNQHNGRNEENAELFKMILFKIVSEQILLCWAAIEGCLLDAPSIILTSKFEFGHSEPLLAKPFHSP